MGVETPIPPNIINTAAPERAPRGGFNSLFSWKPTLPRRAPRGALRRGALLISSIYTFFNTPV
jgi:hypothetical protein